MCYTLRISYFNSNDIITRYVIYQYPLIIFFTTILIVVNLFYLYQYNFYDIVIKLLILKQ